MKQGCNRAATGMQQGCNRAARAVGTSEGGQSDIQYPYDVYLIYDVTYTLINTCRSRGRSRSRGSADTASLSSTIYNSSMMYTLIYTYRSRGSVGANTDNASLYTCILLLCILLLIGHVSSSSQDMYYSGANTDIASLYTCILLLIGHVSSSS
jgi:hypothetical protein